MRTLPIFAFTVSLTHVAQALYSGRFCPLSCQLALNYVTFNDTEPLLPSKIRSCQSNLRTTALYLCFDEFCTDDGEREKWIETEGSWCDENANITLPRLHDVVGRWTDEDRAKIRRVSAEDVMDFPTLDELVLPNDEFIHRAYTTMVAAFGQYDLHLVYGWYMYYFWIVVVAIGIGQRLFTLIRSLSLKDNARRKILELEPVPSRAIAILPPAASAWVKRHLTVPALFGNRCSQPYGWCTIPPRLQSLTVFAFILLNLALCTISYEVTDGNLYWPRKSMQLTRYVSDRTGIISLVNFPLIWLFGMRNDVLIWITGWGFGTYNAFHRWVARIATLQAVIHSVGYTIMILDSGSWSHFLKYWTKHYFWNGEIATIAMCALLAFSFYGIRRAHYEIFLITHIVMSIAALWTMFYHVEIFINGEWNIFIWPCLAIWIADRVLRVGRTLAFNRQFWNTKATITYDAASNLMQMAVDGSKSSTKSQPGTYYYIHVLDDLLYMHQSHPFTLAFIDSDVDTPHSTPLSPVSSRPTHHRTDSSDSDESDALLTSKKPLSASNLNFLIRPYDGFTSRLKSHCLLHPKKLRVLVEGPYGHSEPLHLFPSVLFVVGGTGIAVALSHLARLLSPTSHVETVKIVWAVREHAFLASVLSNFKGLLADERIEMEVHITQDKEVSDEVLGEDVKSVRIMTKRPDVASVIRESAQYTGRRQLAVVACGPARMADEARKTTVEVLGEGHSGVEYFEESFKW